MEISRPSYKLLIGLLLLSIWHGSLKAFSVFTDSGSASVSTHFSVVSSSMPNKVWMGSAETYLISSFFSSSPFISTSAVFFATYLRLAEYFKAY